MVSRILIIYWELYALYRSRAIFYRGYNTRYDCIASACLYILLLLFDNARICTWFWSIINHQKKLGLVVFLLHVIDRSPCMDKDRPMVVGMYDPLPRVASSDDPIQTSQLFQIWRKFYDFVYSLSAFLPYPLIFLKKSVPKNKMYNLQTSVPSRIKETVRWRRPLLYFF